MLSPGSMRTEIRWLALLDVKQVTQAIGDRHVVLKPDNVLIDVGFGLTHQCGMNQN